VDFTYTPATAGDPTDLINYKTPTGHKIQKSAIEKLDVTSNLASEHHYEFMESRRTRAIANGWIDGIFAMTREQEVLYMMDHYGMITEAEVAAKYNTYMFQGIRQAQDSHNVQGCLESLLTPEARLVINADKDKYTVRRGDVLNGPTGPGISPEEQRRDGLMYLYCIINRTTAKTHATVTSIVRQINAMREVLVQKDSDVQAFNTNIQHLTNLYYDHKRQKVDEETMMTGLFDSYSLCKDIKIVTYTQRMKEDWWIIT
jgi:hypothetical protein